MPRPKAPLNEYSPSALPPDHRLVVLGLPRGSNNFESRDTAGVYRLVELGTKIRKMVIVTRGDFAIIRLFPPSPADLKPKMSGINHNDNNHETRQKLLGEVVSMVDNKDVKMWKKAGEWPAGFGEVVVPTQPPNEDQQDVVQSDDNDNDDDDIDNLAPNPNH